MEGLGLPKFLTDPWTLNLFWMIVIFVAGFTLDRLIITRLESTERAVREVRAGNLPAWLSIILGIIVVGAVVSLLFDGQFSFWDMLMFQIQTHVIPTLIVFAVILFFGVPYAYRRWKISRVKNVETEAEVDEALKNAHEVNKHVTAETKINEVQ
ncbi:hypothetical protein BH10PAT2_BH10PAT2_3880 [soil metagenome]